MPTTDVIIGPPGTGKTTYLSRQRIPLATQKYGAQNVLVTSYSKAAARELAGRDLEIPPENVGTLHSMAYAAIGRPDVVEDRKHLKEWSETHPQWAMDPGSGSYDEDFDLSEESGSDLLQELNNLRSKRIPRDRWSPSVVAFAEAWERFKLETGTIDYTDMIEMALAQTSSAPGTPTAIFVDEAQDVTALEMALLQKWAQAADQMVYVGDPYQCLYQFRGARGDILFDIEAQRRDILRQSHRVPRAVLELSMRWLSQLEGFKKGYAYHPTKSEGRVALFDEANSAYVEPLVERIGEEDRKVMVLASCAYMLNGIARALKEAGIPFHNPYRPKEARWNPLGKREGTTSSVERLLAYLYPTMSSDGPVWTARQVKAFIDVLKADGNLVRGGKEAVREALTEEMDDGERWRVIGQLFTPRFLENALDPATALDYFAENLVPSSSDPLQFPLAVARRAGPEALTREPRIVLGTVHSVKGGEADIVYVVPDISRAMAIAAEDDPEENAALVRLFYVAVTRARQDVCILGRSGSLAVNLGEAA